MAAAEARVDVDCCEEEREEIIVDGYQSKDGSHRANGRDLTLPNGQTLFLGSSGTGAPYDKK